MPCLLPDGTLTESARSLLAVLEQPLSAEEVAARMYLPLYRIRGILREMAEAGLVLENQRQFSRTKDGANRLQQTAE